MIFVMEIVAVCPLYSLNTNGFGCVVAVCSAQALEMEYIPTSLLISFIVANAISYEREMCCANGSIRFVISRYLPIFPDISPISPRYLSMIVIYPMKINPRYLPISPDISSKP